MLSYRIWAACALFCLTACNQQEPQNQSLAQFDGEVVLCPYENLQARKDHVASCTGKYCFEESVTLYCEVVK